MTSDHHPSTGAGNQHSPAPLSIPIFAICDICGRTDEHSTMADGMCRECVGLLRESLRAMIQKHELRQKRDPFNWTFALAMATITAAIVWRWVR